MDENRVNVDGSSFQVVQKFSLKDVMNPPIHQDVISMQQRLIAGGGVGAVTSVVINKVIGKSILKLPAKALLKVVASKAAATTVGAGAGAAGGAAVGSVVPGVGTAAGAAIGGIIGGLGVGVSVDKMLIELEESINREEFKSDMLSEIRESREEFKAKLRG